MRILLVRLREIGDVVFTTPLIGALRTRFPNAHLTYVVEPGAAPVVVDNPNLDEVIVVSRLRGVAGLRSDLAIIRRLRAGRYDIALDFHGGPRASLFTWLSAAPMRVGYDVAARGWMYTRRVSRPRELRARHSVQNQWDLLAAIGLDAPDPAQSPVEMRADPAAAHAVGRRLAGAGVGSRDPIVVMHVSAGNPFRRWPLPSFAAVAAGLVTHDEQRRIVVTSGPSERPAAAQVILSARALLPQHRRDRVLACGDFSLAELRALVDRAALFIGGDSGPMHIASTSCVPIVALYGPTLPARSAPWRAPQWPTEAVDVAGLPCRPCNQRACTPGDFRCLTRIQPQQVLEAAERALTRAGTSKMDR